MATILIYQRARVIPVSEVLQRVQKGHDVSGEARDKDGKWTGGGFHARTPSGGYAKHKSEGFKIGPIECFTAKQKDGTWTVHERTTGLALGKSHSDKEDAIQTAIGVVKKVGSPRVIASIKSEVGKGHIAPSHTQESANAKTAEYETSTEPVQDPKRWRYVARYTQDPKGDIKRGWSAYMGHRAKTFDAAADQALETAAPGVDLQEEFKKWKDPKHNPHHIRDHSSYTDFLKDQCEQHGVNIQFDPKTKEYCDVHHEGLSVWPLMDAENADQAEDDAQDLHESGKVKHGGFGHQTHGHVEYVRPVNGVKDLHIFRADDTSTED